jgi:cytochrome c biogenesis protein
MVGDAENSPQTVNSAELGLAGWMRWIWRSLTSMKTALILLLLLAAAAIPGSVFPQRSADPNGVASYYKNNPELAKVLDWFQLFDVYTSVWFSAIYILLFVSLIGCVVPRTKVHWRAMRAEPVDAPARMQRFPGYAKVTTDTSAKAVLDRAESHLKGSGYRVVRRAGSVAAERGYLRETGNLVFHFSLIGVLVAAGLGGGFSYNGQRVLVEGEVFVNNLASYDSFSPGVFFDENNLEPFSMSLDKFEVDFDIQNTTNIGTPLDFRAFVSSKLGGSDKTRESIIRVNEPLEVPGAHVYLTGNGYAPVLTFKDPDGQVAFSGPVIFLPQDANYTSLGVIKLPDAKPNQYGVLAFFYPTKEKLTTGAYTSIYPEPIDPLVSMNLYVGNLGLDEGVPRNVFSLETHGLEQVAGGKSGTKAVMLGLGETKELPGGLGSVTFNGLKRFASLDLAYNPGQVWVLFFAILAFVGLAISLSIPRRRIWVRKFDGGYEVAALARTDDPKLEDIVAELVQTVSPKKGQGN